MNLKDNDIAFFNENGYLIVSDLLAPSEVTEYRQLYDDFLTNKIDASGYRSDLASHLEQGKKQTAERITQIMVPSRIVPGLLEKKLHRETLRIAKQLIGDDVTLDFDMLIDKAPYSNTPTPWHQDSAYWITMPDIRAASCWVALDNTVKDNGCMWYVPGSHLKSIRPHYPAGKGGGALECKATEDEGVAAEIRAGSCVFHHGGTLHYSRGNSTYFRRRAFITNFRPEAMVRYEREQGYDHTSERKVRNKSASKSKQ